MYFLSNEVTPHPDYLEEGPLSPMIDRYEYALRGYLSPIDNFLSVFITWLTSKGVEASV